MRNYKKIVAIMILFLEGFNLFGQQRTYPFQIEKIGKGQQTIIFIPGFASSGEVWEETTTKFEKNFTCYVLTMAGFAGVRPQSNPSFNQWSEQIVDFIKKEKINQPIVIGHSMGGGLALNIASKYPKLIKKIIVVDVLPCLMALTNPSFISKKENDCSAIVKQITSMPSEQFYQMQKANIPTLVSNESMQDKVVEWSITSDRKTFAMMYCDFMNVDLREKIQSIECPTLVLLESYFKNYQTQIAKQYKKLKKVDLQYADKGLHFIMYDDKEWYFKQLNHFIIGK